MPQLQYYTPRTLLSVVAGITGIVPYIADWNETHIYNPKWPGHAKFHNGQTMSMGVCLGLGTLWKAWFAADRDRDGLLTASVFASLYYVTMFTAWFYPDATAFDPPEHYEFSFPHLFVLGPNLAMVGLAYGLEQKRLRSVKDGKKE